MREPVALGPYHLEAGCYFIWIEDYFPGWDAPSESPTPRTPSRSTWYENPGSTLRPRLPSGPHPWSSAPSTSSRLGELPGPTGRIDGPAPEYFGPLPLDIV